MNFRGLHGRERSADLSAQHGDRRLAVAGDASMVIHLIQTGNRVAPRHGGVRRWGIYQPCEVVSSWAWLPSALFQPLSSRRIQNRVVAGLSKARGKSVVSKEGGEVSAKRSHHSAPLESPIAVTPMRQPIAREPLDNIYNKVRAESPPPATALYLKAWSFADVQGCEVNGLTTRACATLSTLPPSSKLD